MFQLRATLRKRTRVFLPQLLATVAFLALANSSYATDYKVYPGAGCQPRIGTQAGSFVTTATGMRNSSSLIQMVTCPLVRDRIPTPEFLDPGVRVASPSGGLLTCTFFIMDQNGFIRARNSQSTTATTPTPLVFSVNAALAEAAGSYAIECRLPPNGRVINYSLGEKGETGNAELP